MVWRMDWRAQGRRLGTRDKSWIRVVAVRGEVGDRGGKCVGGRKDGVGVGMREGRNPG